MFSMQTIPLILAAIFASTSMQIDLSRDRKLGKNGWFIPQANGSLKWMDIETADRELHMHKQEDVLKGQGNIKFFLYTRDNPEVYEEITDSEESILNSNLKPSKPTRFVTHGWLQGYFSPMNQKIRDAWLEVDDFNIIWVDWNRARTLNYISAVAAVPIVGKRIADMIDYLVKEHNMQLDTLGIIGHSLGAHVAGHAGKNTKAGKINIIVGLDPAEPMFSLDKPTNRVSSDDAHYVEIIHTNAGILGFLEPIGDSDFYVNGGRSQPGCLFDLAGVCSHNRVASYYAEAVKMDNFPAIKCNDYKQAIKGKCGSNYSSVRMAAAINALLVRGEYYVPVNKKSPYGALSNFKRK